MQKPATSHLGALPAGLAFLRRHPVLLLGLALLSMILSQLGPALELAAGVGPNPVFQPLFGFAGLLPLEMYFIPRLQAQLDAESLNAPQNPVATWHESFDARWVRTFLTRLGLSLVIGFILAIGLAIGLATGLTIVGVLFFFPGIVILTLFGWAPMRMLLRGDALLPALQWSQSAMARHWPRVIQAVLAMLLVGLVYLAVVGWGMSLIFPSMDPDQIPSALQRLKHPAFWLVNLTGGALNLWFSCALLALYQRLEGTVAGSV